MNAPHPPPTLAPAPDAPATVPDRVALRLIAGFWTLYFVIVTVRMALAGAPQQDELLWRRALVAVAAMGLSFLLHRLLRRIADWPTPRLIAGAALACIPLSLAFAAVNWGVMEWGKPAEVRAWEAAMLAALPGRPALGFWPAVLASAAEWYFFIASLALIWVAVNYGRRARALEARAARLARAAKEAELRALRYQVNPHFLFNTLNSLSSLVMAGRPEAAEAMILNLSGFFRASLAGDPAGDVALSDEVATQRRYLEIEAARFPGRLRLRVDVPDALAGTPVPGFILQPLVENAVRCAVAPSRGPVTLSITAAERDGRVEVTVADDGRAGPGKGGTGLGLRNVRERLEARFGGVAGFRAGPRADGGWEAVLTLPKETGPKENWPMEGGHGQGRG